MLLFYKFKGWKISNGFTNCHISEREVLVLGSLFNKVESLRIRAWQRYFFVSFAKSFRTVFSRNKSGQLRLRFATRYTFF